MEVDVPVTELEEFEPDRVDGVKAGANGFPILMMKGLPQVPEGLGETDGEAEKAELDADARNALDDSDFAYIDAKGGRHLPIHDEAHVRAALSRFGQTQFDNADDKKATAKKLVAAAKKFDIDISEDTAVDDAAKSADEVVEPVEKDGVVSGTNPVFGSTTPADASVPGSPTWEAADADTAAQAAQALLQAAECIRTFAAREGAEVAAGEGSDLIDEFDALCALDAVTCALGIMARLAFLEGNEATKETAEKAGARNSSKDLKALRAARDHLNSVIGDGDDNQNDGEDAAEKAQGDILAMATEQEQKFAEIVTAAVKAAIEPQAPEADDDAKAAKKAAKAEKLAAMSDEEREAYEARKAEKRAAEEAAKAAKEASKAEKEQADVKEVISAAVDEAVKAVSGLYEARMQKVEKMAAPGGPVKTRQPADIRKSEERDALEIELAHCQSLANGLSGDPEMRKGYQDRAAEISQKIAALA